MDTTQPTAPAADLEALLLSLAGTAPAPAPRPARDEAAAEAAGNAAFCRAWMARRRTSLPVGPWGRLPI